MTPLNKNVIVKPIEEKNDSTILMPDTATARASFGNVIAVSEEVKSVKVGDIIHWPAFIGVEVIVNEEKYMVLEEKDILFKE